MKNLKNLFLLTLILLISFSCDSDDETSSEEVTISKLIGTWKFTSSATDGILDTDNYICDFMDINIITETTITTKYYEDPSGTNGSNCVEFTAPIQNYTVNGNQITTTVDNETFTQKIITLNNTTLVTEYTEDDGNSIIVSTETYTKQ